MPRTARIVIPDVPHHITQRGNDRQDVFFVDNDRRVYLSILRNQLQKYGLLNIACWKEIPSLVDWRETPTT